MKYINLFIGVAVLIAVLFWYLSTQQAFAPANTESEETDTTEVEELSYEEKPDLIRVDNISGGTVIRSPLVISGEARGYWFFEASFPIMITNWDGLIIAEGYATAQGDWMTESFVPFVATIEFTNPYNAGDPDFMRKGIVILQKDNPSGLPENDNAIEIPVFFASKSTVNTITPSLSSMAVFVYDDITMPDDTKVLNLSSRNLSGSLKAEIRMLTQLEELDISNNNFTGLPAEVGQLSKLRILNLSDNDFTGLPQELGNLQNLEVLDLRGTNYSEFDLNIIRQSLPSTTKILID